MKVFITLAIIFMGLANTSFLYADTATATESRACANTIDVTINGLVCDFCARALEKVFGKREEVNGIDVDLDNAKIHIQLKEGRMIDDATVRKLISDSGYDVVTIHKGC